MSESLTYPGRTARARPGSHPIRADDGVRHCHCCLFALGAYVGRHLSNGAGFVAFITAFGCLIAMRFAAQVGSADGRTAERVPDTDPAGAGR
jgi:hypothetical protein